jgi:hypothetical protein
MMDPEPCHMPQQAFCDIEDCRCGLPRPPAPGLMDLVDVQREFTLAPSPVLWGRRKQRQIIERINGGPWVVIHTVANCDALSTLEVIQRVYRRGQDDRSPFLTRLVAQAVMDRAHDTARRDHLWPPLP